MNAREIGRKLVQLCKEGKNLESVDTLYAEDIESIEAAKPPMGERITRGIANVRKNNATWLETNTVHSHSTEGPYPHGDDKFAVRFNYDVTHNASGQRMKLDEVAVFTVKSGKVVREEFFYDMG
jgi:ketosteroid isomerase-like protein